MKHSILSKRATFIMLFLILFLYFSIGLQAQTQNATPTPNFAPKSPEAAAFLKYGEYPVDLATGVPSISVPLYTIDLRDFKMPISLDYHASGIKVNQEATWVGLGWNLNAGAQVILSPRDDIDENNPNIDVIPNGDAIIAYFKLHPYDQTAVTNLDYNLDKSRVKDMYVFSSPTVNGSFYIRNFASNDVVTIPPNAFKVDLVGLNRESMKFKITDPQGNVYSLGTTEISIQSMTHSDRYISAWYVDEIKTPSNNKINFTYQDDGNLTDKTFSQRVEIKRNAIRAGCPSGTSYNSQIGDVIDATGNTVTILKKIKEITFNDGNSKIVFTKNLGRQDLVDGAGNGYLSKIEIQQLLDVGYRNVKGYTFDYSYFNPSGSYYSDKRLKLDRVVNLLGRVEQEFTYSNIALPNKTSKGQDFFGYNNGKSNNVDLIPKHYISYPYPTEVGRADRSVNSLENQAGILKEIHYPTKGWTKFNYETNQFYGIDLFDKYTPVIVNSGVIQGTGGTMPIKEGPGIDGVICLNKNPDDCVKYVSIPFTATEAQGQLKFTIKNDSSDPTISKYYHARVRVFSGGIQVYDSDHFTATKEFNESVFLKESGTIEVEVYGKFLSVNSLQLKYVNNDPTPKNNLGAGLRIASIENYDNDSTLALKKQYDYSDIIDFGHTSGQLINKMSTTFQSNSFTNYSFIQCGSVDPELIGCAGGLNSTATYSISSNSRFGIEGNSVAYKYVREIQIDVKNQANNGYTQYEFTIAPDEIPFGNPTVQIPTAWKRGKVLNKKVYKTVGTAAYIVEEEKNTYFEDPSNTSFYNGFKMFRMGTTNNQENPLDPLNPACPYDVDGGVEILRTIEPITYNIPILWFYQKTSEKTNYFYNPSNILKGKVVSNTTFNYGNPLHLQLTSQTTTNSVGETLQTKYFYAPDPEMISKPFSSDLASANMIGIPLNTQAFKDGVKISEQLTSYEKISATSNLLLPRFVYANKGTAAIDLSLDKKITYDLYDEKGNVLQYTIDGGTPVSIIWGYSKTQPIAKIDNLVYGTIPAETIANLQALSNDDSDNCLSDNCSEQKLRNALNLFRNTLPNAFISTYTYNPLVGVTSITDPKGLVTYYEYDTDQRLRFVKDSKLNVLQKYCYNYKGQTIDCGDNSSTSVEMYKSAAQSGTFTRNNCEGGGLGSSVVYNQAVGAVISTVSQGDADTRGLAKFNVDGQLYANSNAFCTYSSIARSGNFTKNDCAAGGAGSSVAFSQAAGAQTSILSQADADSKGLALFNSNGQANANAAGFCTFNSIARSGNFTKNDCAAGGAGSSVAFSQAAGAQTSILSQADADSKGLALFNSNGQANANANGTCTYSNATISKTFTKNDCPANSTPGTYIYTVPAGKYTGASQVLADRLAQNDMDANGQYNANMIAECFFYSVAKSGVFTKNDCGGGLSGSNVTYTVPSRRYVSNSQENADNLAQSDVNNNGQAYANANGSCAYNSIARSGYFVRNNCGQNESGSSVYYNQIAGAATSAISQADADALGLAKFNADGQSYANNYGGCTLREVEFLFERYFDPSTKVLSIDAWATGSNHNGATLKFTVNFLRLSGAAASQEVVVEFAAGQTSKLTTLTLNAKSIVSITLLVTKK
ncbi:MAG: hypothetical protein J7574_09735 [Flavobacterium sp.]|uniref:DUF5977 domain-containing protein n=1 Tax=Flavobacterium sp. TaxID=239 RepID=UPI001B1AF728|nr:DUF5977 domain-containing protein [Flavobacterium sp.]MBO9584426.1 hypothetical protein [Flavobacterium sp.]